MNAKWGGSPCGPRGQETGEVEPIAGLLSLGLRFHFGSALFGTTGGLVDTFLCAFFHAFGGAFRGMASILTSFLDVLARLLEVVLGGVLSRRGKSGDSADHQSNQYLLHKSFPPTV